MMAMKDIAVSSGSACSSAQPGDSHVLRAIGLSASDAKGTLRFGLGRFTTREEIDYAVRRVVESVHGLETTPRAGQEPVHAQALSPAEELPRL